MGLFGERRNYDRLKRVQVVVSERETGVTVCPGLKRATCGQGEIKKNAGLYRVPNGREIIA